MSNARACRPRASENWRIAAMTDVYPSRTLSPLLSIAATKLGRRILHELVEELSEPSIEGAEPD
jgi:hypothetical protein